MAGEEITKYAINSTLGTDKFEPLDKILFNVKTFTPTKESVLVNFGRFYQTLYKQEPLYMGTFKPAVNGSIYIAIKYQTINSSSLNRDYLDVFNENQKRILHERLNTGSSDYQYFLFSFNTQNYSFAITREEGLDEGVIDAHLELRGAVVDRIYNYTSNGRY